MTIGTTVVVKLHKNGSGAGDIDSLDFTGTFSYTGSYTSNVVVQKDDIVNTTQDKYIVTFYWASGAGPNLGTITVAMLLANAVTQVNLVLPSELT